MVQSQEPPSSTGNKVTLGAAIGCLAACLLAMVGALCFGGLAVNWLLDDPENVNIDVSAPLTVSKGEAFTIEVQIENTASEYQTLNSIDIDLTYLDGIAIEASDPAFIRAERNDLFESAAFQSYYFEQVIPAGETMTVTFSAVALKDGDFAGDLDVCLNSISNCLSFPIRTVVGE